jgi:hypothetical protein
LMHRPKESRGTTILKWHRLVDKYVYERPSAEHNTKLSPKDQTARSVSSYFLNCSFFVPQKWPQKLSSAPPFLYCTGEISEPRRVRRGD